MRPPFQNAFINWINGIKLDKNGKTIAIDGKSLRRSFDKANGKGVLHMVSAWAVEAGIAIGQVKTNEKSNEINAIPSLLDMLDISGAIITIDAMGCQKKIASKIIDKEAEYVLALKGNHSDLHNELKSLFKIAEKRNFKDMHITHTLQLIRDMDELKLELVRLCLPSSGFQRQKNGEA